MHLTFIPLRSIKAGDFKRWVSIKLTTENTEPGDKP